jgi:hypothetical protein
MLESIQISMYFHNSQNSSNFELNARNFELVSIVLVIYISSYSVLHMEFCKSDFGWTSTEVDLVGVQKLQKISPEDFPIAKKHKATPRTENQN